MHDDAAVPPGPPADATGSGRAQLVPVTIYTLSGCGYCVRALRLLDDRGIAYTEVNGDRERDFRRTVEQLTGGYTVPQVVIDGRPIGGSNELAELARRGMLDTMVWGDAATG